MRTLLLTIVVFFLSACTSEEFDKASTEKFDKASTLAEQGNASAQFNLGNMYNDGQGVTQDYKQAEKWTFSDASGFWSSPTSELTINSEDLLVSVQISCANFYRQPRLRINIHYEGYDWDEIKGEFTVVLKGNHATAILKKYEFGRTKLYFKSGVMQSHEDDDSEIINLIKAGNSIQINYTTFDAKSDGKEINNELHSNWNTDLFKEEFTKLNATCK